jgi:hypothetical protein
MKIFRETFPEWGSDFAKAREFAEAVHRTIHSNATIHPAPVRPDTVRGVHPCIVDLTTPCQRTQGSKLADTPASVASSKTGSTGMTSKNDEGREDAAATHTCTQSDLPELIEPRQNWASMNVLKGDRLERWPVMLLEPYV